MAKMAAREIIGPVVAVVTPRSADRAASASEAPVDEALKAIMVGGEAVAPQKLVTAYSANNQPA